jgi:hypothetical protein
LQELCRCVDLADQLAAVIDRDGMMVTGDRGQLPKAHPLLLELRETQKTISRLISELAIPLVNEVVGVRRSPQQKAAAVARWRGPRKA